MMNMRLLPAGCLMILLGMSFMWPAALAAAEKKPVKASQQEISLSASLRAREEALEAREKLLAEKEQELIDLQKELDAKIDRLVKLQGEVKLRLDELKGMKDQRFLNLIKVYSTMSASKVAPLLDKMEDAEAVEILKAMKPEAVAKILPKMDKDKAVRLSRDLGLL